MVNNIYNTIDSLYEAFDNGDYDYVDRLLGVNSDHLARHVAMSEEDMLSRIINERDSARLGVTSFYDRDKMYLHIVSAIDRYAEDIDMWRSDHSSPMRLPLNCDMREQAGYGLTNSLQKVTTHDIRIVLEKDVLSYTGFSLCTAYPEIISAKSVVMQEKLSPEDVAARYPDIFINDLHRTAFSFRDIHMAAVYYGERRDNREPFIGVRFPASPDGNRTTAHISRDGPVMLSMKSADNKRHTVSMFEFSKTNPSGAALLMQIKNRCTKYIRERERSLCIDKPLSKGISRD